jgi:hypothetical protein
MTHRQRVLALAALSLAGCCFAPQAAPAPAPVAPTAAASGPGAPGCPDLATSIVGTWAREGVVEEYRADGSYVLNGMTGTIAWMRPGHATIDVPAATFHMEYDLALADATTLVSADPNHVGAVATRTTPAPSIPAPCFDLSSAWVGTWSPSGGGPSERYDADGTYAAPGAGTWSFTAPGHLHLAGAGGANSDYVLGMASPSTALAVSLPPLAPAGVAYTRAL